MERNWRGIRMPLLVISFFAVFISFFVGLEIRDDKIVNDVIENELTWEPLYSGILVEVTDGGNFIFEDGFVFAPGDDAIVNENRTMGYQLGEWNSIYIKKVRQIYPNRKDLIVVNKKNNAPYLVYP